MAKKKPCESVHPKYNVKCWKRQHDDDEKHWACIPKQGGSFDEVYW